MNGDEKRYTEKGNTGPWSRGKVSQHPKTLRQPNSISGASATLNTVEDDGRGILEKSVLNVNAQEFVPSFAPDPVNKTPAADDLSGHQWQTREAPVLEEFNYLMEAIYIVTLEPGRYEEFLPPIRDIVETFNTDEELLSPFVDIIIEKSIAEPNFRYSGARMCRDLVVTGQPFIQVLLDRVGIKHRTIQAKINEERERTCAFALLLAELYLHLRDVSEQYKMFFAHAIYKYLIFLVWPPVLDGLKTACQILKLCGTTLELEGQGLQPVFDRLIQSECTINDNSTKLVIQKVLEMHKTNFYQQNAFNNGEPVGSNSVAYGNNFSLYNDPVFYGPDGKVLTEEENLFLRDNVPLSEDAEDYIFEQDGMDDEISAAFEEFLSFSENKNDYNN